MTSSSFFLEIMLRRNGLFTVFALTLLARPVGASFAPCYQCDAHRQPGVASKKEKEGRTHLCGWLDSFLPVPTENDDSERRREFPEQYPATYELSDVMVKTDGPDARLVRPLLKQTQLESRPLQVAYDANKHGWNPRAFHQRVDGKGAAIVVATTSSNALVGGYNPKGWAGLGGARPSVAAFLFYKKQNSESFQKLRKVGGGGLACARDDPNYGICLGADGLVIALEPKNQDQMAFSKLGPYFERGPDNRSSLFESSGSAKLSSLKVLVGVYQKGEEIPYSGAVLDMTSG